MQSGFGEPEEFREGRDDRRACDGEAIAEELVEGDAELAAGFEQPEHGVPSNFAILADGASGDLSLGDDGSDVIFRPIGVKRDLGPIEDAQQIVLLPVQAGKLPIEHDVAGLGGEDPVEPRPQHAGSLGIW